MKLSTAVFLIAASLAPMAALEARTTQPVTMTEAVRHQLAVLPRYGVFDTISFRTDGSAVILTGQVMRPSLKDDAGYAVRHVEGVTSVVNNIEVLPLSPNDDRIRLAVLRAIYGSSALSTRYAINPSPAIRIIVKNGNVRLEGFVATAADRTIAGMRANSVFGAFRVDNDLKIG